MGYPMEYPIPTVPWDGTGMVLGWDGGGYIPSHQEDMGLRTDQGAN